MFNQNTCYDCVEESRNRYSYSRVFPYSRLQGKEFHLAENLRELVKRCLAGTQDAMIELVDQFRGQVFGLCYRMLGNRQDAEDAAQETFIRVLKNLDRWDSTRDFEPWLLAIAGNRCRTALAKRVRRPPMQTIAEPIEDDSPDFQAAENLAEEVSLGLQGLRQELREAFVLFHDHQLSYVEISESMDCPVGTAKTWVHRARRELIEHLRRRGVVEESGYEVRKV